MRITKIFCGAVFLCFEIIAGSSEGAYAAVVSGSVSFDPSGDLYTYSYTLDNTNGPGSIKEFSVLVGNISGLLNYGYFVLPPVSFSSPNGWGFQSGATGGNAQTGVGSFYQWGSYPGALLPGAVLSGFSFTTAAAPATFSGPDYFIYGSQNVIPGDDILETGNVVVPAVPVMTAVPEVSTWAMLILGLVSIGFFKRRKSRPLNKCDGYLAISGVVGEIQRSA